MINSRKEAEQLVRTCKYAPKGYRSFGPVRASIYAGSDYATRANDTLVVMPMIETKEAVQNIDEILSTPGIDAHLRRPGRPLAHARLHAEARPDRARRSSRRSGRSWQACKRHKVIAGLHNATSRYALKMASQGWQFVTLASDSRFLAAQAAEEAAAVKQTVASGEAPRVLSRARGPAGAPSPRACPSFPPLRRRELTSIAALQRGEARSSGVGRSPGPDAGGA